MIPDLETGERRVSIYFEVPEFLEVGRLNHQQFQLISVVFKQDNI